jgi:hypothetical protein
VASDRFTPAQRQGLEASRTGHERTLVAMHQLEAALEAAANGREAPWRADVVEALGVLSRATREESENAALPDSLLSDMARNQPRLRNRVRGVRTQYRNLREAIEGLQRELEQQDLASPDVADLRQRLAWIVTALRHVRARESDLIYEAYYDAFKLDLTEDRT